MIKEKTHTRQLISRKSFAKELLLRVMLGGSQAYFAAFMTRRLNQTEAHSDTGPLKEE